MKQIIVVGIFFLIIGIQIGLLLSIDKKVSSNTDIQQQYLLHSDSLCRVIAAKDSILELREDLINGCVKFFNDSTKWNCNYYKSNEGTMILWDLKNSEYGIRLGDKWMQKRIKQEKNDTSQSEVSANG